MNDVWEAIDAYVRACGGDPLRPGRVSQINKARSRELVEAAIARQRNRAHPEDVRAIARAVVDAIRMVGDIRIDGRGPCGQNGEPPECIGCAVGGPTRCTCIEQ